jgi:hypothetical protein
MGNFKCTNCKADWKIELNCYYENNPPKRVQASFCPSCKGKLII